MDKNIEELVNVMRVLIIRESSEWFNFEIDSESGKVYYCTECCLEVITFEELIERLLRMRK